MFQNFVTRNLITNNLNKKIMLNIILLIVFIASICKVGIEVQKFENNKSTEFIVMVFCIAFPFVCILINAILEQ